MKKRLVSAYQLQTNVLPDLFDQLLKKLNLGIEETQVERSGVHKGDPWSRSTYVYKLRTLK